MLLLSLFRRDAGYVGFHATERRAPQDAVCETCGKPENITDDFDDLDRVVLAQCSMCETWMCTPHYTMHTYVPPAEKPQVPWWKRVLR
jgi:hypothetical protein